MKMFSLFDRNGQTLLLQASTNRKFTLKDFTKYLLYIKETPKYKLYVSSITSADIKFDTVLSYKNEFYSYKPGYYQVDVYENDFYNETLKYTTIKEIMYDFGDDTFLEIDIK
jgi:hypothetical protein